ncbi:MAG: hypothetical protein ACI97A_003231 [Planctomycetota bacterium]|jgi:hypothetical protein
MQNGMHVDGKGGLKRFFDPHGSESTLEGQAYLRSKATQDRFHFETRNRRQCTFALGTINTDGAIPTN